MSRRIVITALAIVCLTFAAAAVAAGRGVSVPRGLSAPRAVSHRVTASASKPVDLSVEVNGDILVHQPVWERALQDGHGHYDFVPMLSEIAPLIKSADLAICHIETPMTPRAPEGYPVFNTPTQLAAAIKQTGWKICDTASNHSVDQGQYGIDQTGLALDRAGVLHTGSFSSVAAQRRTLIVTVKGVKVAFLAYTEMTNGIPLPHPWSVNIASVAAVRAAARRARRLGARVVIVNFHWGNEFVTAPSAFQLATASALARDPDITAIVGQHVHVVQPIVRVHGKLVVYGEGQILSNETSACCVVQTQDGMLVFLHIVVNGDRSHVASITYVPTYDRHPDYKVLPIGEALAHHQAPAQVLKDSYERTTKTVGRIPHVLTPVPAHIG
jgi:poly-gamma-glutamate capsule biosynthesis protein CapA/YwtB (metallophosphatase superfamily)